MGPKNISSKGERNVGSDCFAFLQWMSEYEGSKHKIGWRESVEMLAKKAGIPMEADKHEKTYKMKNLLAERRCNDLCNDEEALEYLASRQLNEDTILKWKIGVTSKTEFGERVKRVSFPLLTRYNQVVGESNRAIEWSKESKYPKYWNSPNSDIFHKGSYLYGFHNYDSNFPEIRITEGAMDVVTADQFGVRNVVCPLGTAFTKEHAQLLKAVGADVCFCMDGDEAGLKGIKRAVSILAEAGVYAKVFIIPDGMDLAELALKKREETEKYILENTKMYWEYMMKDAVESFASQLTQLRARFMPEIIQASKGVTSPEDNILMKSYVREKFGITL